MINPDNFIFHSDFWYPTDTIAGMKRVENIQLPQQIELADVGEHDYFKVWHRDWWSGHIIGSSPYMQMNYYVENGKLKVAVGAQFGGAKFSGDFYYRIYRKSPVFLFNTDGKCEIYEKSIRGVANLQPGVTQSIIEIPVDVADGDMLIRGDFTFQGKHSLFGIPTDDITINDEYRPAEKKVRLTATLPGGRTALNGEFFAYNIQLVRANQDHPWTFNSDKFSFVLPGVYEQSIRVYGTVPAKGVLNLRGTPIPRRGTKQVYDYFVRHSVNNKWQVGAAGMRGQLNFNGWLDIQPDSVTPVVTVDNRDYAQPTIINSEYLMFRIYEYQNNIN